MSAFTSLSRLLNHKQRFVLLTTFLIFISLFGGWFDPATAPRLSAWKVGIAQDPVIPGRIHLFSFGVAGAILCYFLWRAAWRDRRPLMALLSAALLFLTLDFWMQIAISRPTWLKVAQDGVADFLATMNFANKYSITTAYMTAPDGGIRGDQLTFAARLLDAYPCMSFGWLWCLLGSIAALVASLTCAPGEAMPGSRQHSPRRWAAVGAAILAVQLAGPLAGQYYVHRGDAAATKNDPAEAESFYRHAIADDSWYRVRPYVYLKIGALQNARGDRKSPEARLYLGLDMISRNFYPEGMDWLAQAQATDDADLRQVVQDQIAAHAVTQGVTYYSQGAQGMAQAEWAKALQVRPERMGPYYMMGRSNQDLTNYPAARAWFVKVQSMSRLPVIKALCLSAIGDTYYLTGQAAVAREYYLKSMAASYTMNIRGMKSLLDDYYR